MLNHKHCPQQHFDTSCPEVGAFSTKEFFWALQLPSAGLPFFYSLLVSYSSTLGDNNNQNIGQMNKIYIIRQSVAFSSFLLVPFEPVESFFLVCVVISSGLL